MLEEFLINFSLSINFKQMQNYSIKVSQKVDILKLKQKS